VIDKHKVLSLSLLYFAAMVFNIVLALSHPLNLWTLVNISSACLCAYFFYLWIDMRFKKENK